ncbi:MAG: preprotein translocase subunit SecG [Gammaproteobacteria bacterium]|nr:preprotein translocase subunit SecG [Gammaproteobacteria bacterium]
MDLFETVLLILLVIVSVSLGGLVLIQQSKGADIGAAFGSGAANTLFGSSGATSFIVKFTAALAIGYFLIAFGLAYTAKERADSLKTFEIESLPAIVQDGDAIPTDESADASSEEQGTQDIGLPLEGDDMPDLQSPPMEDVEGIPESSDSNDDETADLPDF